MKKEVIMTGKNVDEAVELACKELGASRDSVQVEVIELQKKAFFGLKVTPAKVRVTFEKTKGDLAADYIDDILKAMNITAEIDVKSTDDGALIKLEGDDLGVIIGRRGETLDAIQYLASLVANRGDGEYFRITVDSGNFREKREATLKSLAAKIAAQAIRTGRSVTLEPMNPNERRIIHAEIQNIDGVVSTSSGEEPHRCVVVSPTNPRRYNNDRRRERRPQSKGQKRSGEFNRTSKRRGFNDGQGFDNRSDVSVAEKAQEISSKAYESEISSESPLYSKIEL